MAARIRRVYGREAIVLHPPRGLDPDGPTEAVAGIEPGFYLTVSRSRGYKRSHQIAQAFAQSGRRLVQVGGEQAPHGPVTRVAALTDAQLRWLYANARALIAIGDEDFGLTPVECYAFGTPAIVLAEGGYLETASPESTVLTRSTDPVAIQEAMAAIEAREWDREAIRRHAAKWSPEAFQEVLRKLVLAAM